jgi:putative chitinase
MILFLYRFYHSLIHFSSQQQRASIANSNRCAGLGRLMSSALAVLEDFYSPSSPDPAVAAAVMVLANASPPMPPPTDLHATLRAVAPHLSDAECFAWVVALTPALQKAGIIAPRCVAAFMGQCAHESGGFRDLEEDLSYSAARLCQVWPSRFPALEAAAACALQPEILANRVYADRLGNGDEASGDGWRFRGRGLIQITGRFAYERFATATAMALDQAAEYAATQGGAADSAAWFWVANELNALAATWSIDLLTRKINGGMAGAAERSRLCEAALHALVS